MAAGQISAAVLLAAKIQSAYPGSSERRSGVSRDVPVAGQVKRLPKLAGTDRQRVATAVRRDYESGLTLRQVAIKYGRSIGGTRGLLLEAGTAFRPGCGRGGVMREVPKLRRGEKLPLEEQTRLGSLLVKEYQAGKSIRELCLQTGYSIGRMRRLLEAGGVQYRGRGGATHKRR